MAQISSGSLPSITLGNISLNSPAPTISSSSTTSDLSFTSGSGQIDFVNSIASFNNQVLTTPGPVITGGVVLALPLKQVYFITATLNITVSLPIASAAYTGSRILFRRTAASINTVSFNQADGLVRLMLYGGVTLVATINFPGPIQFATEFICDGTNWIQLYVT